MRRDLPKLSIGEAFDEAFDLYKRNFGLLALTAAILYVPADAVFSGALLSMRADQFSGGRQPTPQDIERLFGIMGVMFLAMGVFYGLIAALSGAITLAASERYLDRPITVGQAYKAMFRSLPRLLGAWLLVGIIITVGAVLMFFVLTILFAVVVAGIGSAGAGDEWVGITLGVVYVIGFLLLAAALFVWFGAFVTPAIMLERSGALLAIQRNIELVRGRGLRLTLGFIGLVVVIVGIQNALLLSITGGLGWLLYPWLHPSELTQRIIEASIGGFISLFVQPLWMTTFTVLYYDQRVRKEGFDLALMLVSLDTRRAAALAQTQEVSG